MVQARRSVQLATTSQRTSTRGCVLQPTALEGGGTASSRLSVCGGRGSQPLSLDMAVPTFMCVSVHAFVCSACVSLYPCIYVLQQITCAADCCREVALPVLALPNFTPWRRLCKNCAKLPPL